MAFGFPAFHSEDIPFTDLADESQARSVVEEVLALRRMKPRDLGDGIIIGSLDVNFWSWGEKVSVRFHGGAMTVRSECALPTQCFDWGRNRKNVNSLSAAIRSGLEAIPKQ